MVILPDGDRLMRVALGAATETVLEVQSDRSGKLVVSAGADLGVDHGGAGGTDELDALWDRVRLEAGQGRSGVADERRPVSGGFLGLGRPGDQDAVEGKPRAIDRAGIVAVGFDPSLVNYPRPESGFLELTSADGTRFGRE